MTPSWECFAAADRRSCLVDAQAPLGSIADKGQRSILSAKHAKMSGGGGLKNLFFKINTSIGNAEKTKMTPEYNESVERYDSYHDKLDPLVARLVGALQHNPHTPNVTTKIDSPPGENPHEQLAASLEIFKTYIRDDQQAVIDELIKQRKKMAVAQRNSQWAGRRAIRALRHFFSVEYKKVTEEKDKLSRIRDHMDMIKHDVKTAKNTEQIEKSALLYEEAVQNFDEQAKRAIELLDALPKVQQVHAEGITEYFEALLKHNAEMAQIIRVPAIKN
uniref:BAR domain-containing protein n=1 Tax=Steinernema glaseri TaxID=37863 RepID=A0A1I7YD17_9BILA